MCYIKNWKAQYTCISFPAARFEWILICIANRMTIIPVSEFGKILYDAYLANWYRNRKEKLPGMGKDLVSDPLYSISTQCFCLFVWIWNRSQTDLKGPIHTVRIHRSHRGSIGNEPLIAPNLHCTNAGLCHEVTAALVFTKEIQKSDCARLNLLDNTTQGLY